MLPTIIFRVFDEVKQRVVDVEHNQLQSRMVLPQGLAGCIELLVKDRCIVVEAGDTVIATTTKQCDGRWKAA